MAAPLDIDQLRTFTTIVDMGSFTRAADEVNKTQSAVSMQMRRLEERVGKTLFEKNGRVNRLTGDGERLLAYARKLVRLNNETLAAFDDEPWRAPFALERRMIMPTGICLILLHVLPNQTRMSNCPLPASHPRN